MTQLFRTAARVALLSGSLLVGAVSVGFAQLGVARPVGRQTVDAIIVKLDNQIVLRSDLENIYQQEVARAEGKPLPPDVKCQILESIVLNKLMLAKAEVDSVVVEDDQVKGELDRRMAYFVQQIGSEQKLEEYYKKPIKQLKDDLRPQVKEQLIQQKMQEEISGKVTVTPREVRQFFSRIPKDSLPYYSTEVEVGQIIKFAQVNQKVKQEAQAKLNDIRARIQAGEDFEKLAKEFSQDPGSAAQGGYLGFFKRRELVPEYEAAALRLEPGQLSPIVESQFGFHLIQLIERKGETFSTRHILLKPATGTSDVSEAAVQLSKVRKRILADSVTFAKAAKDVSDDKNTSGNGGLIQNPQDRSNYLPLDKIDPAIFFIIDTMKVGSITPPMPYRTDDGKDAMRILWLKSNNPPHQANLQDDYQKIAAAALNEKKNKALDEWFKKNRGDVYIEVDPQYAGCKLLNTVN
ncbi:periplasmic chaperone for outer membrane proteins SurA [Hymenobacter roseosalivarius DSM 11622]|uniref:Periplasmic chaperone for outer membrane proteins SurA n=1 Tax=Hymenobacter roseosalivarius DSM 11622 TaxID=645990 RepID=A0A1W1VU22_9BACT|nr:peptidylprolyl isomerase [Hymenobacter roseosalivarius]SMB96611.1 periplasmic chaperone for outer membrane proteins SurA [Hymenobacter roseosalivarius DSM 11622]